MLTGTPETVTLVPINRIEILNSRDRNMKVFLRRSSTTSAPSASKNPSRSPNAPATMASLVTRWSAARGDSTPSFRRCCQASMNALFAIEAKRSSPNSRGE